MNMHNIFRATALFTVFDFYRKKKKAGSMTGSNSKGKLNLENNLWFLARTGERPISE